MSLNSVTDLKEVFYTTKFNLLKEFLIEYLYNTQIFKQNHKQKTPYLGIVNKFLNLLNDMANLSSWLILKRDMGQILFIHFFYSIV